MEKTLVSIIIPVYNREKYLKKCLDSIINQTLKNIEIIIINDGSTDSSDDIIESYNDERIKYVIQANKGISAVRNRGIEIAEGEYIGFVDSDDWIDTNFFELLYNSAKKHSADVAVAGIVEHKGLKNKYYLKFNKECITNNINKKFELCNVPKISYVWNKIYKLSSLKESNIRFEEGRIYEDVLFTPQILINSDKMVIVLDTYYHHVRHEGSIVTIKNEKAMADLAYMKNRAEEYALSYNLDLNSFVAKVKKYGIFGITFFRIVTRGKEKEYRLFNILIKKIVLK